MSVHRRAGSASTSFRVLQQEPARALEHVTLLRILHFTVDLAAKRDQFFVHHPNDVEPVEHQSRWPEMFPHGRDSHVSGHLCES